MFELAMVWQTRTPLDVVKHWVWGDNPIAYQLAISWPEMVDEARESLEKATRRMKKYMDQH